MRPGEGETRSGEQAGDVAHQSENLEAQPQDNNNTLIGLVIEILILKLKKTLLLYIIGLAATRLEAS